jgi:polysaccharide deacetylase family protein (PEP-CTERM system associated)
LSIQLPTSRQKLINAFTVDVEDYYQVDAFSSRIGKDAWPAFESRVVANTGRILRLLGEAGIQGTFFVLGYVARHHPELVREIHREGHEIGCHGYWHEPIYRQTPEQFRQDLQLATAVLSELTGEPVAAYRAPNFSIRRDTLWALDILADEGYSIDSSIFPVVHDQYGLPGAERGPHFRKLDRGGLWEFPPSVCRTRCTNIPIAGGGYFRLFPFSVSRWLMRRMQSQDGYPLMFYIHPWEVDVAQPRLPGSWKARFRHYQNLRTTEPKLSRLVQTFKFGTVSAALESANVGYCSETQEIASQPDVTVNNECAVGLVKVDQH